MRLTEAKPVEEYPLPTRNDGYAQFKSAVLEEQFLLFKLHAWLTSAPVAWLCYKCGMSANAVTVLGMILSVPAALLNVTGNYYWAIAVFHVFFLIDCVDGVLARATKTTSLTGAYLDDFAHYVFHAIFFISLGTGLVLEHKAYAAILAIATGLINNLMRAHIELVKVRGGTGSPKPAPGERSTVLQKVKNWILRSFDFPNILVYMTFLAWRLSFLELYFAYCIVMTSLYVIYCSVRHAWVLKEMDRVRATIESSGPAGDARSSKPAELGDGACAMRADVEGSSYQ
jgi:phosphatidylglycerophosphate synthase